LVQLDSKNPYGITAGAVLGHGICTAIAVIGGRLLASRISVRAGESLLCCAMEVFVLICFPFSFSCSDAVGCFALSVLCCPWLISETRNVKDGRDQLLFF